MNKQIKPISQPLFHGPSRSINTWATVLRAMAIILLVGDVILVFAANSSHGPVLQLMLCLIPIALIFALASLFDGMAEITEASSRLIAHLEREDARRLDNERSSDS